MTITECQLNVLFMFVSLVGRGEFMGLSGNV